MENRKRAEQTRWFMENAPGPVDIVMAEDDEDDSGGSGGDSEGSSETDENEAAE